MKKTQNSCKILKKLKPKFQKNSKTSNSSWVELAENVNCPKKPDKTDREDSLLQRDEYIYELQV